MAKKITLEISEENEHTAEPYWLILDPREMMEPNVHTLASMVTGPFFSREAAEAHLESRSYAFSERATVYCHSGCWSHQYKQALRKAGIA